MMGDFVEYSAKTRGEAITKACIEMGVTSDQLEVQVVSEGSTGFFGLGSKPAVVRVRKMAEDATDVEIQKILKEVSTESIKEEEEKAEQAEKAAQEAKAIKQAKKEEARVEKSVDAPKTKAPVQPPKAEETTVEEEVEKEQPKEKVAKDYSRPRRDRKDSKYGKRQGKDKNHNERRDRKPTFEKDRTEETAAPVNKPEPRPIKILTDPEEIKDIEERAKKFLTDIFDSVDLGEVVITSQYNSEEGCLDVDFEGEDMGVLIGKRGQTLDSLQYLTSLVVNKNKDDYIRVKLDTEDYRRRRKDTLENLARGIAYKVRKTHRAVVLEPMNPYERRIIHSSLQSNKYVETMSEGEEPYRHVVVKPTKF